MQGAAGATWQILPDQGKRMVHRKPFHCQNDFNASRLLYVSQALEVFDKFFLMHQKNG